MTTLELSHPDYELRIELVSELGKRERRAIARNLLRSLRPWLSGPNQMVLHHSGNGVTCNQRTLERGFREFEEGQAGSEAAAIGSEIRMVRLKIGMSQEEAAAQIGIPRGYLSRIERGLHRPRKKLLTRIREVLIEE